MARFNLLPRALPQANRFPGPTLIVLLIGLAAALFLVAQVSLILALVLAIAMMLSGVVLFARVEYLLHMLVVIPLIEGLRVGPITIGRVASIGALMTVVALLLFTDWTPVRTPLGLWLPSVALVSWAVLSGLWSTSTSHYVEGVGRLVVGVSVLLVIALTLKSVATFTAMMRTYVIAASLLVIPATLQALAGSRAIGLHVNPNQFARGLVLAMLALAYLIRVQGLERSKPWLLLAPVLAWGTLATGSRMGLLVLVVACLFVAYDLAPRQNRLTVVAASVLVIAVGFGVVVSSVDRYDPRSAIEDRGAARLDIWLVAARQVENAPVHGMGLNTFRSQAVDLLTSEPGVVNTGTNILEASGGVEVHNQYLDYLVNLGVVGLGLYLWAVVSAALAMWRCPSSWRPEARALVLQMLAIVSFTLFFGSAINNKHLWMLIGISIAMNALPSRSGPTEVGRVIPSLQPRHPESGLRVR